MPSSEETACGQRHGYSGAKSCSWKSRLLDSCIDHLFLDKERMNPAAVAAELAPNHFSSSQNKDGVIKKHGGVATEGSLERENDDDGGIKTKACASHGAISIIGRRREMEDAVSVELGVAVGELEFYDFFGVYDGHGGAAVANACKSRMHQLVAKEVFDNGSLICKGKGYWEKVMGVCFKKMDDEVASRGKINLEHHGGDDCDEEVELVLENTVGSTAVVLMVGKEELVVANCGDSRAVLCQGGHAVALSNDHKPDRPDERQRVEASGGRVIDWHGNRVLGLLDTSRSIGDQYLKPYISSEPEVTVIKRSESDDFIVIGTDGIWDVISNECACEVVKKYLACQIKDSRFLNKFTGSYAAEAAAILAELAMAKGSKDNISVVVVELKGSK